MPALRSRSIPTATCCRRCSRTPPRSSIDSSPRKIAIGYKPAADVVLEHDTEAAKPLDSEEGKEWSHVDSNHGPPACEAGALTS